MPESFMKDITFRKTIVYEESSVEYSDSQEEDIKHTSKKWEDRPHKLDTTTACAGMCRLLTLSTTGGSLPEYLHNG